MLRQNIINFKREITAYAADLLKTSPLDQVRVVIFAQGRTGSTVLEDLLCSSGYFCANGELLSKDNSPFQRKIIWPTKYIVGLSKRGFRNFIFHVKIVHLLNDQGIDPGYFLKTLFLNGWKIIYLRRDNKIKHVLSNYIATARGQYHKYDERDEHIRISIDCPGFCQKIRNRMNYDRLGGEALQDIDYLKLVYEEDLERQEDHQKTADKVLDYLALERRKVYTKHKRVNEKSLEEVIENYEEFIDSIYENGFECFL